MNLTFSSRAGVIALFALMSLIVIFILDTQSRNVTPPSSQIQSREHEIYLPSLAQTQQPVEVKGKPLSWCNVNSKSDAQKLMLSLVSETSVNTINETNIYGSLHEILGVFTREGQCLSTARHLLKASHSLDNRKHFFIDMGSRKGDQTTMFLNKFPNAADFEIHCFEANPAFNSWYKDNERPNLVYHNAAVGIRNITLWLSNRDVGSSIVDGKGPSGDGILVSVIDFPSFLVQLVAHNPSSEVIIKMDIEKMEYSVLLRMLQTGAFFLVDDLLLECHYTTNKPKSIRPAGSIGKDDCVNLVHIMNTEMNREGKTTPFEAVLWNNVKTAKSSGYSSRHGGFYPT